MKKILPELFARIIRANAFEVALTKSDLYQRLEQIATDESLEYIKKHMKDALCFSSFMKWRVLQYGLSNIKIDGDILEFGVMDGNSITFIANKLKNKTIHGFDSFEGLPEDWTGHGLTKNALSRKGKLPKIPKNVILHRGLFADEILEYLKTTGNIIAFLHVDCDIYSSTKTIFDLLGERIVVGTRIVFDEYMNYNKWQEHEFKAFQEFIQKSSLDYKYLAFGGKGNVCVEIVTNEVKFKLGTRKNSKK